jgi:hypothetical protein
VRRIEISVVFKPENLYTPADEDLCCEQRPSDWAKVLLESKFGRLVELTVNDDLFTAVEGGLGAIPVDLQQSIEDLFARRQDKPFTPRLTLRGYGRKGYEKFPRHWEIVTKEWFEDITNSESDMGSGEDSWGAEQPEQLHIANIDGGSNVSHEDGDYLSAHSESSL